MSAPKSKGGPHKADPHSSPATSSGQDKIYNLTRLYCVGLFGYQWNKFFGDGVVPRAMVLDLQGWLDAKVPCICKGVLMYC